MTEEKRRQTRTTIDTSHVDEWTADKARSITWADSTRGRRSRSKSRARKEKPSGDRTRSGTSPAGAEVMQLGSTQSCQRSRWTRRPRLSGRILFCCRQMSQPARPMRASSGTLTIRFQVTHHLLPRVSSPPVPRSGRGWEAVRHVARTPLRFCAFSRRLYAFSFLVLSAVLAPSPIDVPLVVCRSSLGRTCCLRTDHGGWVRERGEHRKRCRRWLKKVRARQGEQVARHQPNCRGCWHWHLIATGAQPSGGKILLQSKEPSRPPARRPTRQSTRGTPTRTPAQPKLTHGRRWPVHSCCCRR